MAEDKKTQQVISDKVEPTLSNEAIAELQEQVKVLNEKHANLNQGIAGYRDETQKSKKQVEDLEKQIAEFKTKQESKEDVDLSPEDQKKFDAIIKKKGLVTKEELTKQKQADIQKSQKDMMRTASDAFLKKHPEFDDDEAWTEVNKLFIMYKTPTTVKGFNDILGRIYKELSSSTDDSANKLRAKLATKSRLSLGGGSQKGSESKTTEDLQKKYPNLSKDQIETREKELDKLLKD